MVIKNALLGYTGFVGSHIRENLNPETTEYFNSKNLKSVLDSSFDRVYCACVPAVKWLANQNPEEDMRIVSDIGQILREIRCNRMYLVSTIDVHDHSEEGQVEDNVIPSLEPYGKHRFDLETSLREVFFDKLTVLRLPALFGVGLKKNSLFDLMNDNNVRDINSNSRLQWYSMHWLWEDIVDSDEYSQNVVNLYSEPIETTTIVRMFFPDKMGIVSSKKRVSHDHSSIYGIRTRQDVLDSMRDYIDLESSKKRQNNLVVSNMAWDSHNNEHAAFLMSRYGIRKVEIVPTKMLKWEDAFSTSMTGPLETFKKYGITVYSVQSVFYGIEGGFGDENVKRHLVKVVRMCENVGAKVIVMGTPVKRKNMKSLLELQRLLHRVQKTTDVKICLEPNSKEYGCWFGNTLDECKRIRESCSFYISYDTGNAAMENDRLPNIDDHVAHVQISGPLLKSLKKHDYEQMMSQGVMEAIRRLRLVDKFLHVSLETVVHPQNLGEQIRRFSRNMLLECPRKFSSFC